MDGTADERYKHNDISYYNKILISLRERHKREKSEEKIDCHHQDSNQGPSLVPSDALNTENNKITIHVHTCTCIVIIINRLPDAADGNEKLIILLLVFHSHQRHQGVGLFHSLISRSYGHTCIAFVHVNLTKSYINFYSK